MAPEPRERREGKLQVTKPLFGNPTLKVAGGDQTKLVDGLAKQVALVRDNLPLWADAPNGKLHSQGPAGLDTASAVPAV